ncbi:unnamed protein product, partial [Phaeothamnion confervicola]
QLLLGPLTDAVGGRQMMVACLACLSASSLLIASSTSLLSFGVLWVLLEFVYSSGWGASISVIRSTSKPAEWPSRLGALAASSRAGSVLASLGFGALLSVPDLSWRWVYVAAAITAAVPALLLVMQPEEEQQQPLQSSIPARGWELKRGAAGEPAAADDDDDDSRMDMTQEEIIKMCAANPEFWRTMALKSMLMVVGSFVTLAPLYLATTQALDAGAAARASVAFSLGSVVSNVGGSAVFKQLAEDGRRAFLLSMGALTTACTFALYQHTQGWLPDVGIAGVAALLFGVGFCYALPCYVPPSMVAMRLGGKRHSAFITNAFDI